MGNLTSAGLLRLAILAACSPLSCVGNQTFDDGSDGVRKRDAQAPKQSDSTDGVDASDTELHSADEPGDTEATDETAPPSANDAGAPAAADAGAVATALDAASPSASSGSTAPDTNPPDANVPATDAGNEVANFQDAGSSLGGRDLDGQVLALAYGDGLFVAVGANGQEIATGPNTSWLITSRDGRNWTQRIALPQGLLRSVAYAAGRWVAVGWDVWQESSTLQLDSHPVFISDDGVNWELVSIDGFSQPQQLINVGEGFVLNDIGTSSLSYSEDGEAWEPKASAGPVTWLATAELWGTNSERPLFAGRSDGKVSLSLDLGDTWSEEELPAAELSVDRLWLNPLGVLGSAHSDACTEQSPTCSGIALYRDNLPSQFAMWGSNEKNANRPYWPFITLIADGIEVATDGKRIAHRDSAVGEWLIVEAGENPEARFSEIVAGGGSFVVGGAGGLRYSDDGIVWQKYDSIVIE